MFTSLFHLHVHDEFWDNKVGVWTNMFQDIVMFLLVISHSGNVAFLSNRSLKPTQHETSQTFQIWESCKLCWIFIYGCFLKWWYPQNTPKWSFLVGKPMVVGYHHFRKPPYRWKKHCFPRLEAEASSELAFWTPQWTVGQTGFRSEGSQLGFWFKVYQLDLHP